MITTCQPRVKVRGNSDSKIKIYKVNNNKKKIFDTKVKRKKKLPIKGKGWCNS